MNCFMEVMLLCNFQKKKEILKHLNDIESKINAKDYAIGPRFDGLMSLVSQLDDLGYECELSGKNVIRVIESNHVDVKSLTFYEGNYDSFRQAVINGLYSDYDNVDNAFVTEDEWKEHNQAVCDGKIHIMK